MGDILGSKPSVWPEQEADDKNRMLKQRSSRSLELQTDEEPEFVEEIGRCSWTTRRRCSWS